MKVYALIYKDTEIVRLSSNEFDLADDYRWSRKGIRHDLKLVEGTFTKGREIERNEEIDKEDTL